MKASSYFRWRPCSKKWVVFFSVCCLAFYFLFPVRFKYISQDQNKNDCKSFEWESFNNVNIKVMWGKLGTLLFEYQSSHPVFSTAVGVKESSKFPTITPNTDYFSCKQLEDFLGLMDADRKVIDKGKTLLDTCKSIESDIEDLVSLNFRKNDGMRNRLRQLYKCQDCENKKYEPNNGDFYKNLEASFAKKKKIDNFNKAGIMKIVKSRPLSSILERKTDKPVIAICFGTTSRNIDFKGTDIFHSSVYPLFNKTLPAYVKFLEKGFEYWFVIGMDKGDVQLDNKKKQREIRSWFKSHVETPANLRGIIVQLNMVAFENTVHKPGPVFNIILHSAYVDGADYFYRTNDDTIPITHWTSSFVEILKSHSPSNFGVVGPVHEGKGGNMNILTHDFVHRTHFEVFEKVSYYPRVFLDWYLDDWISHIYGDQWTHQAVNILVDHQLTMTSLKRYQADRNASCFLEYEIIKSNNIITKWLQRNGHI